MADNQIDNGDLMECLVLNKHQKEMNEKCAVGVTHFQLVIHLQTPNLTFVSSCHYDIQLNVRDKNKIKKTNIYA